ncbi:hypothetical protein Kpol_312p3 [Vanderwaltozyma polyspora DSM 70294]|uniref:Thioredoxin domain-containing protein n=1 Tax=Vanderwaltozyma polyspora (strain ATCC 22028 / DSM 70294 / BCRC 21397 / CBS 2163 / NBRC 10782 / NRRL Y-8283 / UCD 57-17) TaxID=436907 RepID=A7TSI7_VANPO|nr:uncharacterized protein Kpol_312p3 [Vanderwaltozyma polyspora DSM 70294]EDO14765.1 hypothetical protein Kpol_312p3 [Vanderwaltozyma polyspora DSM 70294]
MLLFSLLLIICQIFVNIRIAVASEVILNEIDETFPDPLTTANFDDELLSGLHIIDFYSPYCSHCKHLQPVWNETWYKFREESKKLKIKFSQVNCIESGDLCHREKIRAYPSIKLYNSEGFLKEFPKDKRRTVDNLIEFARNESLSYSSSKLNDNLDLSEKSGLLKSSEIVSILAGNSSIPHIVSFWPNDQCMSNGGLIKYSNQDGNCEPFVTAWEDISKRISLNGIQAGHVNCVDTPTLCSKIGVDSMIKPNTDTNIYPKVALILPNKRTNNIFFYTKTMNTVVDDYVDFATRLYSNSQFQDVTFDDIEKMVLRDANFIDPETRNKIYLVYSYDKDTSFEEDMNILEYILEPLSSIDNIYLYKTNSNLFPLVDSTYDSFYKSINYNSTEPEKTPNEEYHALSVMTQQPTFFIFKDGSSLPYVFSAPTTMESRNEDKVIDWIETYSLPFVSKVSDSNFNKIINKDINDYNILSIQIIDTSSEELKAESKKYLDNMLISFYDFEYARMNYSIDMLNMKRKIKSDNIMRLRAKNLPPKSIHDEMTKQIQYKSELEMLLATYDISKGSTFLSSIGIDSQTMDFNVGDVILIERKSGDIFVDDIYGARLKSNSPYVLRETFKAASGFPHYEFHPSIKKLNTFDFAHLNKISQGSLINIIFALFFVLFVILIWIKNKHKFLRRLHNITRASQRNSEGILGNKASFRD